MIASETFVFGWWEICSSWMTRRRKWSCSHPSTNLILPNHTVLPIANPFLSCPVAFCVNKSNNTRSLLNKRTIISCFNRIKKQSASQVEEEEEENHHQHHVLHVGHLGHFFHVPRVNHFAQCYCFLSILYNWANATGGEEGRKLLCLFKTIPSRT